MSSTILNALYNFSHFMHFWQVKLYFTTVRGFACACCVTALELVLYIVRHGKGLLEGLFNCHPLLAKLILCFLQVVLMLVSSAPPTV